MKVNVELSSEYREPYATIYTDKLTEEIQAMIELFSAGKAPITALKNEDSILFLQPDEIYMVRIEGGNTMLFCEKQKYRSRKRLYELEQQLGKQFMQISRSTLVNLAYLDSMEAGFNGTMLLKLKNGCKDYVSRAYLPEFRKYLGL